MDFNVVVLIVLDGGFEVREGVGSVLTFTPVIVRFPVLFGVGEPFPGYAEAAVAIGVFEACWADWRELEELFELLEFLVIDVGFEGVDVEGC